MQKKELETPSSRFSSESSQDSQQQGSIPRVSQMGSQPPSRPRRKHSRVIQPRSPVSDVQPQQQHPLPPLPSSDIDYKRTSSHTSSSDCSISSEEASRRIGDHDNDDDTDDDDDDYGDDLSSNSSAPETICTAASGPLQIRNRHSISTTTTNTVISQTNSQSNSQSNHRSSIHSSQHQGPSSYHSRVSQRTSNATKQSPSQDTIPTAPIHIASPITQQRKSQIPRKKDSKRLIPPHHLPPPPTTTSINDDDDDEDEDEMANAKQHLHSYQPSDPPNLPSHSRSMSSFATPSSQRRSPRKTSSEGNRTPQQLPKDPKQSGSNSPMSTSIAISESSSSAARHHQQPQQLLCTPERIRSFLNRFFAEYDASAGATSKLMENNDRNDTKQTEENEADVAAGALPGTSTVADNNNNNDNDNDMEGDDTNDITTTNNNDNATKQRKLWENFFLKYYKTGFCWIRPSGNPILLDGLLQMFTMEIAFQQVTLISIESIQILSHGRAAVVVYTTDQIFLYKGQYNEDRAVMTSIIEATPGSGELKIVHEHRTTGQPIPKETRWATTSG